MRNASPLPARIWLGVVLQDVGKALPVPTTYDILMEG